MNEENNLVKRYERMIVPKVLFGLIIIIVIILLVSLYKDFNIGNKLLESQMSKASIDYYKKYMSVNDSENEYLVTLDMLRNANENGEKYNLSRLKKCKKQTTYSKIYIAHKSRKVKKIKIELNC